MNKITRSPNRYRSKVNLSENKQTPIRRRTPTRVFNEAPNVNVPSPNFNNNPQPKYPRGPSKPIERMVVDTRPNRIRAQEYPRNQNQMDIVDPVKDSRPLNPLRNYDDSPPTSR